MGDDKVHAHTQGHLTKKLSTFIGIDCVMSIAVDTSP